jgi:hypothetical protein
MRIYNFATKMDMAPERGHHNRPYVDTTTSFSYTSQGYAAILHALSVLAKLDVAKVLAQLANPEDEARLCEGRKTAFSTCRNYI